MDVVKDLHMGSPATNNLGGSLTSTGNVNPPKKRKRARKKKKGGAVGCEGPHFSLDNSSLKTDATIKDPLHESPVNSTVGNKRRKRKKRKHNAIEGNVNGCDTPENTFSPKSSMPALDVPSEHPIQCVFTDPITSQSCVEVGICQEKEQNMINKAAENSSAQNGVQEVSCGHISVIACPKPLAKEYVSEVVKLNIEHGIKHPLHESQDNSTVKNKRRKRKKRKHNAIEGNVNGCAPKSSTPALDVPSEHPIQCVFADPITSQSCVEVGICQEKEQNMINKAAENSNAQNGVQEVSCSNISVVACPKPLAKEYVSELVKLNIEHGINDNTSRPEDKDGFVNNKGLVKKNDDDPAVYDLYDKNLCGKTYARRKMVNFNCGRSSGYRSPENCTNEQTIQDHHKDDSLKFSDGPLRAGLMDGETKLSIDQVTAQSGAATDEIKLSTDNINEERLVTTSFEVDIPVEQLETNGRQLEHTEITRNDLCCAGDVSGLNKIVPGNSKNKFLILCCAAEEIELSTNNINEQRLMTTSSVDDIPVEQLETNGRQLDHTEISRNVLCCTGDVSDLNVDKVRDDDLKISQFSLDRSVVGNSKKKLLILDVNGILADFVHVGDNRATSRPDLEPEFRLKARKVYKRPFCDDFLQFCFDRFHVGVWSSRHKSNIDKAMEILVGKSASKLLFCWNQSHCTVTHFGTVENINKPLVLKELRKLWDKSEHGLPWEKGVFNESNTLLLDDSPYKALLNPKHTAIFPYSYEYFDTNDSELGPGGDLRVYLEKLAMADNVQTFVSKNPFGQRPIRETNPSWLYYKKVIQTVQRRQRFANRQRWR